jgi:diguanylate cyclase (GGDEF)-like protein/PAS domain S-box-containing protein
VTVSLAQRVGLRPVELPPEQRRTLAAARVAALGFLTQTVLVFGAAAAVGDLQAPVLVGAAMSMSLALLLIGRYERLPRSANRLIALTATLIIAEITLLQPSGERYAPLYLGVVVFVSLYFSRTQALGQLLVAVGLWAVALSRAHPPAEAAQIWVLGAGTLVAAAVVIRSLRDRLTLAAERAQNERSILDAFFLNAPAGFGFLDHDLRHVRVNQALAEIMGYEREHIEGRTLRELAPINANILEPLARSVLESGEAVLGIEIEDSEGDCHLVSYYPVPGPAGLAGIGTAVTDVTHLKNVERRLEETNRSLTVLATTDELTKLPNRRMFGEQLELALARARRGGLAVAILCLDLDRFKEVNDTLGHAYGDQMLVEVAARLRAGARDTDVVSRIGGDEFVILLADLDVQDAPHLAETVAERIRDLLAEPLAINPVELKVEASIGVALYPLDSRDAKGLLAVADAAMYAGKNALARIVA